MRRWPLAVAVGLMLSACGGGGDGDQAPRASYGKLVSFGDSLSDVGSYATTGLVAATGGGKFTVNGGSDSRIWVQRLAAQLGVDTPCAYRTGLESSGSLAGFAQTVTTHTGCHAYAQGGARVTHPVGPGHKLLGDAMGATTVPLVTQVADHLSQSGDRFAADDLVTVLGGANDLFIQLATFSATVGAGGNATVAATTAVTAMATAATELATLVKDQILAKGAQRVVVVEVPDVSQTPMAVGQGSSAQALILNMVTTFNTTLRTALGSSDRLLVVDAFAVNQDQLAHPDQYQLSNVSDTACNLSVVSSSLVCSPATLNTGDTSRYLFADAVHPTPYGHSLLAQLVAIRMAQRGWL
ncbi:GDSL family lipase [Ideonella sp. TBM-1]|uniref:GDSL family lipase n=2 Tax=Ideonella livida TaxID=2707176 RepID=A0A7C9PEZ0_9BURK|nr:GDSL family lipase [Ideonella livida]